MVLEDILSIVLPNCPSTALAQNELWMVDLGFLLFSYFSHLLFLSQLSIQKPARLNFEW